MVAAAYTPASVAFRRIVLAVLVAAIGYGIPVNGTLGGGAAAFTDGGPGRWADWMESNYLGHAGPWDNTAAAVDETAADPGDWTARAIRSWTIHDDGTVTPIRRFNGHHQSVTLVDAGAADLATMTTEANAVLDWLGAVTDTEFTVVGPVPSAAVNTNDPGIRIWFGGDAPVNWAVAGDGVHLTSADAIVPGRAGWERWMWEEIIQGYGGGGDNGPAGNVTSTDLTARRAGTYDRWMIAALYDLPERCLTSDVTAAANCADAWLKENPTR